MIRKYNTTTITYVILIFGAIIFSGCKDNKFTEIDNHLGVPIPQDATNISYNYSLGRLYYIELSFSAPPASAEQFANAICHGQLYEGYDPFNAIYTASPVDKAIFVHAPGWTFYTYSPLNNSVAGNLCNDAYGHYMLIALDKENPNEYKFKLESPNACNTGTIQLPCLPVGKNYINPISNVPMLIAGINKVDGKNVLVTDTICLESRYDYILVPMGYTHLIGASVKLSVDDKLAFSRIISPEWNLVTNVQDQAQQAELFNDCIVQNWSSGSHQITISIETQDGSQTSYNVDFIDDATLLIQP